jgi:hypothetical protein
MTVPDYPSPWWDPVKYEYLRGPNRDVSQADWDHVLACHQCGAVIPVAAQYVKTHDTFHDELTILVNLNARIHTVVTDTLTEHLDWTDKHLYQQATRDLQQANYPGTWKGGQA